MSGPYYIRVPQQLPVYYANPKYTVADSLIQKMMKSTSSSKSGAKAASAAAAAEKAAAAAAEAAAAKVSGSLVTLRARALDVHARMAELVDVLAQVRDGVGLMRDMDYVSLLAKYDALNTLSGQLCEELRNANLDAYVVHPAAAAAAAGLPQGTIPELLRTMRELEIERDVEMLSASYPHLEESSARQAQRVVDHNEMIARLCDFISERAEEHALEPNVEAPRPRAPPAANAILAALTSGAGL